VAGINSAHARMMRIRELFSYRDGDLFWLKPTSNRVRLGAVAGSLDTKGYKTLGYDNRVRMLHRVIWDYHFVCCEGFLVDHIDRNTLNNRIENLRLCSYAQNAFNSKSHTDSVVPFKGVTKMPNGKFRAQIRVHGVRSHLGVFLTAESAHLAYEARARELHGEFFCSRNNSAGEYDGEA